MAVLLRSFSAQSSDVRVHRLRAWLGAGFASLGDADGLPLVAHQRSIPCAVALHQAPASYAAWVVTVAAMALGALLGACGDAPVMIFASVSALGADRHMSELYQVACAGPELGNCELPPCERDVGERRSRLPYLAVCACVSGTRHGQGQAADYRDAERSEVFDSP